MKRTITDAGVARLAVHEGRAELLEEIMNLAPVETPATAEADAAVRRRRRVVPVLVAAAAVATVIAGAGWLAQQREAAPTAPAPAAAAQPSRGELAVLDAPGWTVTYVTDHPKRGGELDYEEDGEGRSVEIMWRRAKLYDAYVTDRNDIGTPSEVDLLGKKSLMWSYSKRDHTVIRPVAGSYSLEVRGSGMSVDAFREVLGELRLIERDQLQQHLPDEAILDDERAAAIGEVLTGVPLPDGLSRADILSNGLTRYEVVADVTGAVTCAWIDQYVAARAAGDTTAASAAQQALGTARDWPALREIAADGGWADTIWQYADIVVAGVPTARDEEILGGREGGIGCS